MAQSKDPREQLKNKIIGALVNVNVELAFYFDEAVFQLIDKRGDNQSVTTIDATIISELLHDAVLEQDRANTTLNRVTYMVDPSLLNNVEATPALLAHFISKKPLPAKQG